MQIKIVGKRYSAVKTAVADSDDDVTSFMHFLAEHAVQLQTSKDQAQDAFDAGCNFLKSKGIPPAARVFRWGDMTDWSVEPPPQEILTGDVRFEYRDITNHVAREGHARDSREDLAARLIEASNTLLRAREITDHVLLKAIELGRLQVLWLVYGSESHAGHTAVSTRHKNALSQQNFQSTEEKKTAAVKMFHELRATYPDKKVKVIAADVGSHFGATVGTVKNWVSELKNCNPTP
ncbi:hypothetical protein ACMSSJ_13755 [Kerstersia gyiorum]|uniref:hypothetical protein n=1 Tax=Kerstersia gyiorum TaxID=206506 RepID=UPI0039EA1480